MFLSQFFHYALGVGVLLLLGAQCQLSVPSGAPQLPTTVSTDSFPYDLTAPSLHLRLASEDLKEISALSPTDDPNIFLAVSDERGEALFVDVQHGGTISKRVLFLEKGDFEGAEMVGSDLFFLRSDGVLFELKQWQTGAPQVSEFTLGNLSKANDLEGLGYEPNRQALLIACKENPTSDVVRRIFAFDLRTRQLSAAPVYTIDPREVNTRLPYDAEDKAEHFFSSSGVAVHPVTHDIYIVSTALKRLVVLDHTTGKIRYALRLSKSVLPQPEGICFDAAGTLYISSEGKGGEGIILAYPYHQAR